MSERRRAFTLAETLCAAGIICLLAGAFALAFHAGQDGRAVVGSEAEEIGAWLSSKLAFAAREGEDFKITAAGDGTRNLTLERQRFGGSKNLSVESYESDRVSIERANLAKEYTFDGEWFTLTPAASFMIKSLKEPSVKLCVTVSGIGCVDIKETPEEQ